MPDTVAIIVTWNSEGVIADCLESLRSEPADIVIVDNASMDATRAICREVAPQAMLIANETNLGFAAAANSGIRATTHPFVLLLNPDTVVHPGAIGTLQSELKKNTKVAAAGGLLLDPQGQPQRGFYIRRFPTLAAMMSEAVLFNRLWPGNPINRRYRCLDLDPTKPCEADQPAGACLLLRRSALEQVRLLDEQFHPLWFEDVDLCLRLRATGWTIVYCPDACVTHRGAHSLQLLGEPEVQAHWYRNLLRYFAKHHGVGRTTLLRMAIAVGMLARIVGLVFARPPRGTARAEAARAYWSVFKNCLTNA